jgi:hypothetical protein
MANVRVVVIAGAGASSRLGFNGSGPPLMPGWNHDLLSRLGPDNSSLLQLQQNLPGDQFEERLGRFLRFCTELPSVGAFPRAGLLGGRVAVSEDVMRQWFEDAGAVAKNIQRILFESLHDLFGSQKISDSAASAAYGPLFAALDATELVFASTNYDIAGELALEVLQRRPYSGTDGSNLRLATQRVHLHDLLSRGDDRTPVLYLHGRVGWYRDPDGRVLAADPSAPYNPQYVPALLLPDPNKTYEDAASKTIWEHFRSAVARAERVLVVGHSLNDAQLVDVLRAVDDDRLAIGVHCATGQSSTVGGDIVNLQRRLNRQCHGLAIDFGPEPQVDELQWRNFINGDHFHDGHLGSMVSMSEIARQRGG